MMRALLLVVASALLATGCARNSSIVGGDRAMPDTRSTEARAVDARAEVQVDARRLADRDPCGVNTCQIEGACYPGGTGRPGDVCRICDPSFSRKTWAPAAGCVITLAGTVLGFADGPSGSAKFNSPEDVFVEGPGKVLVADAENNRIRRIEDGLVTTVAGDGTPGFADGAADRAMFYYPHGIVEDGAGQIFVADLEGHRVRAIAGGMVRTVAGDGVKGYLDGPAATARFWGTMDLALDGSKIYVADQTRVRVIEAGNVSTLAGDGVLGLVDGPVSSARFSEAYGITVTSTGRLYLTDTANHAIRVIFGGLVTTLCGDGSVGYVDGPAATAKLDRPEGIVLDASGEVLFTEHGIGGLRRVASNTVSTIAGSSPIGLADGPLSTAKFKDPTGLGLDSAGRIYVADTSNHRIRVLRLP